MTDVERRGTGGVDRTSGAVHYEVVEDLDAAGFLAWCTERLASSGQTKPCLLLVATPAMWRVLLVLPGSAEPVAPGGVATDATACFDLRLLHPGGEARWSSEGNGIRTGTGVWVTLAVEEPGAAKLLPRSYLVWGKTLGAPEVVEGAPSWAWHKVGAAQVRPFYIPLNQQLALGSELQLVSWEVVQMDDDSGMAVVVDEVVVGIEPVVADGGADGTNGDDD